MPPVPAVPPMKALSIQQPYAFAILCGPGKDVENRTWPTIYRGRLLVHAGLREDRKAVGPVCEMIADRRGKTAGEVLGWYRDHRQLGGIVGAVDLVDCVRDHPSPWFNGPFGFVLANPVWGPLLPCRGRLGIFGVAAGDVTAPDAFARDHLERYWTPAATTAPAGTV